MKRTVALIAPYAVWMVLMSVLPQTAVAYAVRGVLTLATLVFALATLYPSAAWKALKIRNLCVGLLAGLLVFAVWIGPEMLFPNLFHVASTTPDAAASPFDPAVCGWPLTLAKLAASAFVISAAEELFFRKWLVDFAGFGWMVVLFAVEHGGRWPVGAVAGVVYGLVAKRFGLSAAIVAHALTNLVLGLWIILTGHWQFW